MEKPAVNCDAKQRTSLVCLRTSMDDEKKEPNAVKFGERIVDKTKRYRHKDSGDDYYYGGFSKPSKDGHLFKFIRVTDNVEAEYPMSEMEPI